MKKVIKENKSEFNSTEACRVDTPVEKLSSSSGSFLQICPLK